MGALKNNKPVDVVDVLIIGAGIVGISLALELQRAGRQVTVIDRGPTGHGCSYANAGWLTPCFSMPLPQPGLFFKSLGWLLKPDSPLYIKPEFSFLLARWMFGFLSASNSRQMQRGARALTELSKYSLEFYKKLSQEPQSTKMHFSERGLLMISAESSALAASQNSFRLMQEFGVRGEILNKEEVLFREPAVQPIISGGLYYPDEAHAEPFSTVQTLAEEFIKAGGRIKNNCAVLSLSRNEKKISSVLTAEECLIPSLVVLAAGSWSRDLLKDLNISVPLMGGKGYSMLTPDFAVKPTHPIMIVEKKIAVTPREHSVRLAGTLELVSSDESINQRRVQAILSGAGRYLKISSAPQISEVWRGLRPCTPDGLPLLGFSPRYGNLFYSLGHQMLGFQSAPGSAKLCADLIENRAPWTAAEIFSPKRFFFT